MGTIKKTWFKVITFVLIHTFLLLDVAWAGGTELVSKTQADYLSPALSINTQEFMDSYQLILFKEGAYELLEEDFFRLQFQKELADVLKKKGLVKESEIPAPTLTSTKIPAALKDFIKKNTTLKSVIIPLLLTPALIALGAKLGWTGDFIEFLKPVPEMDGNWLETLIYGTGLTLIIPALFSIIWKLISPTTLKKDRGQWFSGIIMGVLSLGLFWKLNFLYPAFYAYPKIDIGVLFGTVFLYSLCLLFPIFYLITTVNELIVGMSDKIGAFLKNKFLPQRKKSITKLMILAPLTAVSVLLADELGWTAEKASVDSSGIYWWGVGIAAIIVGLGIIADRKLKKMQEEVVNLREAEVIRKEIIQKSNNMLSREDITPGHILQAAYFRKRDGNFNVIIFSEKWHIFDPQEKSPEFTVPGRDLGFIKREFDIIPGNIGWEVEEMIEHIIDRTNKRVIDIRKKISRKKITTFILTPLILTPALIALGFDLGWAGDGVEQLSDWFAGYRYATGLIAGLGIGLGLFFAGWRVFFAKNWHERKLKRLVKKEEKLEIDYELLQILEKELEEILSKRKHDLLRLKDIMHYNQQIKDKLNKIDEAMVIDKKIIKTKEKLENVGSIKRIFQRIYKLFIMPLFLASAFIALDAVPGWAGEVPKTLSWEQWMHILVPGLVACTGIVVALVSVFRPVQWIFFFYDKIPVLKEEKALVRLAGFGKGAVPTLVEKGLPSNSVPINTLSYKALGRIAETEEPEVIKMLEEYLRTSRDIRIQKAVAQIIIEIKGVPEAVPDNKERLLKLKVSQDIRIEEKLLQLEFPQIIPIYKRPQINKPTVRKAFFVVMPQIVRRIHDLDFGADAQREKAWEEVVRTTGVIVDNYTHALPLLLNVVAAIDMAGTDVDILCKKLSMLEILAVALGEQESGDWTLVTFSTVKDLLVRETGKDNIEQFLRIAKKLNDLKIKLFKAPVVKLRTLRVEEIEKPFSMEIEELMRLFNKKYSLDTIEFVVDFLGQGAYKLVNKMNYYTPVAPAFLNTLAKQGFSLDSVAAYFLKRPEQRKLFMVTFTPEDAEEMLNSLKKNMLQQQALAEDSGLEIKKSKPEISGFIPLISRAI